MRATSESVSIRCGSGFLQGRLLYHRPADPTVRGASSVREVGGRGGRGRRRMTQGGCGRGGVVESDTQEESLRVRFWL